MANDFTILARVRLDTADIQSQLDRLQGRTIGIHADTQEFELSISVANAIMNEFIDIARDMVEQVAELDSAITEFRKVSDLSGDSLNTYVEELGELGKQVARTTSEMVDGATQFKKSGFTEEESKTLALIAAEYQNIADEAISSGEAANFIISQIKAFNIEAENAEHIINAVNAVSNNFAVSSADLATNIGKASAALAVGGNTYEQTLGLLTSITEINRNGSRSARSLVSIQSRLNQVLDETSSTGEKLTEWYESHNIALYDEEGQLRSLYEIMGDVAKQWDTLSDNEQKYFLLTQAGANQSANLGALMTNFNTALEATNTALNSNGSAMKENAAYMDSIEARTNLLKADFQTLATDIIDSKLVKSVLSLSSSLLQLADTGIGQVIVKATLLGGIVGSAGALAHASHIVPILTGAFQNLGGAIAGVTTLSSGGITLGLAGIAALTVGVVELIKYLKDTNDPVKQLTEGLEDIDSIQQNIAKHTEISTLANRYKELRQQANLTKEEEAELNDIRKQLAENTNGLVSENDDYAESLDKTIDKLSELSGLEKDRGYGLILKELEENSDSYKEAIKQQEEYNNKIKEAENAFAVVKQRWTEDGMGAEEAIIDLSDRLQAFLTISDTMSSETRRAGIKQFAEEYYVLTGNIDALVNSTEDFGENGAMLLDLIQQLSPENVDYMTVFSKMAQDIQELVDNAPNLENVISSYKEKVFDALAAGYLDAQHALELLGVTTRDEIHTFMDEYFAWKDALNGVTEAQEDNNEEQEQFISHLQEINGLIDETQSAIDILNTAQQEYNETGGISVDTLQKLLELDADYIDALFDENGQLNLNADTISGLIDGKNVLLDRLAAEAIATYAVEEAERQLADQNGKVEDSSKDTGVELANLAAKALQTGASFMSAAIGAEAMNNALAQQGIELDQSHFDKWLNNVENYKNTVQNLLTSVNTGLGGWKPTGTGSGSRGGGSKRTTSTTSQKTETELIVAAHNDLIARLESEYSLLEAQGASSDALYKKAQEIRDEYNKTITELQNSEEYLNNDEKALKTVNEQLEKWYNWQTKVVQEIKKANESYEITAGLLESEFNLMEHQGKSVDELVAKIKEIQNNLHQQAEYYRDILAHAEEYGLTADDIAEIQTKINKIGSDWWEWQDKLNGLVEQTKDEYTKLLEEFQKTLEEQEQSLTNQKDAILALQGAMQDYYQGQIDDIDAQIQGLQDANSELEKQVELEEKLDALAKAKQQKVLAYVNGSWQYIEDTDGVSKAQKELDDLERKRKLEDEIAGLEAEKQVLEELRDSWGNMTDEYEKQQNEWLITQELGINTALDGWQRLVQGAQYWANQYTLIMTDLAQNASLQTTLMSGGLSGLTRGSTNLLDNPESSPYYNKPYDAKVDYSAKMLAAQTLDEVLHWASYRDAKIAGEGLSPEHDTQWFVEKWKAEHPGQYALGTLSASGGLSLVGERGAELRVLNRGDGIIPANMTKNLMKWGSVSPSQYAVSSFGGNGQNLSVTIETLSLPNVADGQGFVDYVKNNMFGQMLSFVH